MTGQQLTVDQRRAILQSRVVEAVRDGWQVVYQTDTTADLARTKRFNWPIAIIGGILTVGVLFVLYVAEYAMAKGETAHVEVSPAGEVIVHKADRGLLKA